MTKMTNFSFREHHLFTILEHFDNAKGPLDLFLRNYFRANKALGANDRRIISEAVYGMTRWMGLIDHLCKTKDDWQERYQKYSCLDPMKYIDDTSIPLHIRVSFPKTFFSILSDALGEKKAVEFCLNSNSAAPTTLRVNTLKTTRDDLLAKWKQSYSISPSSHSTSGIIFHKKINFFELAEFKEGLFEVQDEGSQLIADLVDVQHKQRVLDYCAGSGGKTLAFAPKLKHSGQIYLHDVRAHSLQEAKKRLRRAGIQNAQVLLHNEVAKKRTLKGQIDWVLADVPCTGTGTLRRNPDMKWKLTPEVIDRLVLEQRAIFEEALAFMHPEGSIVYATCSVLPQENEQQIAYFMEKFKLKLAQEPFSSSPTSGGMDGFFGAVLKF